MLQHPGFWHKRNGRLHSGLAALTGCNVPNESSKNISMKRVVVEMVPVHHRSHNFFGLLSAAVLAVKASAVVHCVSVNWVNCAVVWGVSRTY